jgi:hypothetical protein
MKTLLKYLRIVTGIWFALAAMLGVTRIAIAGSVFSYYGAGVCAAGLVSWACLRPMKTVLRVARIVIGIWFALCTVGGVALLIGVDSSLAKAGPVRDVLLLAFLAYACLQPEGKTLADKIRARQSRDKPSQTSTS